MPEEWYADRNRKNGGKVMKERKFDVTPRMKAKQAARDQDDLDLAKGRVSAKTLQDRNRFIPRDIAETARILNWKEFS